jgi:hypothetical protein
MEKQRTSIGNAVDACLQETTEEWFRRHKGLRSREEALAQDVVQITATVELNKGGSVRIFVGVTSHQHDEHMHDWYCYQRREKRGYVQLAPSNHKR